MDVLIKDGDMCLDFTGNPVYTEGAKELIQRMCICIATEKGSFIYDKDLGCHSVGDISTPRGQKQLEARLREAIMPMGGVELELKEATYTQDGRVLAAVTLRSPYEEVSTEVII
ncbi:MAG: hypothetical protein IJV88_02010 [Ruminococcus sp.]|nr:hypothetical protein [Ruminococcus sp.]